MQRNIGYYSDLARMSSLDLGQTALGGKILGRHAP